jgi:hypothetical protein
LAGLVLVVLNKAIIRIFTACSSTRVRSMIFDEYGLMAIACRDNNLDKLFHSNGTYRSKNFVSTSNPMYAGFDSKCRFVVSLSTFLRIYY